MSRSQVAKHYQRLSQLWPKDPMRPERQFTKVTDYRSKSLEGLNEAKLKGELRSVNALYSLLDNRYSKKYPTPKHVLAPQSNPNHYTDLMAELVKAPTRGWWENFVEGLKGRIRFS